MIRAGMLVVLAMALAVSSVMPVRGLDYAVSSVISSTLVPNGDGATAMETKLSQDGAYQVGTTFYGPNNPIVYTDLMASVDTTDRNCGCIGLSSLMINVTITDSSGVQLPGGRFLNAATLDSPHDSCTQCQDYLNILSDLYNFLADFAHLPSAPTLKNGQPTTEILSGGTGAKWQWSASFPCCALAYDKGLAFRYQPNFPHPDVYTIIISTVTVEEFYDGTEYFPSWNSTSNSYAFQYVYESDANSGNDAGKSFSTATGIGLGTYSGFGYGADTVDMYKFDAFQGQTYYFDMIPPASADFGIAVYNSNWNLTASSDPGPGISPYGSFTATSTGSYYLKIFLTSGSGTYSFTISNAPIPLSFTLSMNPSSFSVCQGQYLKEGLQVHSVNGFGGWVHTTFTSSPYGVTAWDSYDPLYVSGQQPTAGSQLNVYAGDFSGNIPPAGNYVLTATGTSGSLTASAQVPVTVTLAPYGAGCPPLGSGGSVAAGTLITMADGSNTPVQNIHAGDRLLGYDTSTGQFTVSTILKAWSVSTSNMLVIMTGSGAPYRTDANPHQRLYVKTANGTVGWLSVTNVQVGDELFTPDGWVAVTSIQFVGSGTHTMYDMISTGPYFANGYLDPALKT
jgi:pre-peptidase